MELNVHHLYRTTEDPWEEPDLNLLTVCRLCHEQQPGNPKGGFNNPKRLYVTDEEWWKEHSHAYSADLRKEFSFENVSAHSARKLMEKIQEIKDGIHALRLDWAENGIPAIVLKPFSYTYTPLSPTELMAQIQARRSRQPNRLQMPMEMKADELGLAFQSGGAKALAEALKSRQSTKV
jgi:hypothetical protein